MQRDGFDAGLLAFRLLQLHHLVAVLLAPADVHALQHLGPVLRLGAALPGIDLHVAIVGVGLTGQKAFDLAPVRLIGEGAQGFQAVGNHVGVALGLGELDQLHRVGDLGFQLQHGLDAVGEEGPLAHQLLGVGGVVPEGRVLGERVQLGQAMLGGIPVKDASSAARRTA